MLLRRLLPLISEQTSAIRLSTSASSATSIRGVQMTTNVSDGPVTRRLREKLQDHFKPVHLEVECGVPLSESHLHNVPKGTEIHFRVQIVSDSFKGLGQLQRQRMVNKVLAEELETCVHALRVETKDSSEYSGEKQVAAPACGGGKGI